jgi:hypothetical protein
MKRAFQFVASVALALIAASFCSLYAAPLLAAPPLPFAAAAAAAAARRRSAAL